MESLVAQRFSNDYSIQNDIARLCGARLAVSDEGDKHRQMNTDLVKRLTGGGNLVGKLMCKDKFEFTPTHKLVPLMNHKPRIDVDEATRRRLLLIPLLQTFTSEVAKRDRPDVDVHLADTQLKNKLLTEAQGILAWMMGGAKEWHREGLNPPAVVQSFTRQFFEKADPIESWIVDREHRKDARAFASTQELWRDWCRYCSDNKLPEGDMTIFAEDLEKRSHIFKKIRKKPSPKEKQQRGFYGLALNKSRLPGDPKFACRERG
jgi:putative DNA primase/helicase